jgi:hypothetical protein
MGWVEKREKVVAGHTELYLNFETLGLSVDGRQTHTELYAVLSEAKSLYLEALRDTITDIFDSAQLKTPAGQTVFRATLNALTHSKKVGSLPLLGQELFDNSGHMAVLPSPILVALSYFLDSEQYISLSQLEVTSGHPDFDNAVIPWSNTILWSLPAKQRFFYELLEMYSGFVPQNPLLGAGRIRAAQLLSLGNFLVAAHLKKIGPPAQSQIFLP